MSDPKLGHGPDMQKFVDDMAKIHATYLSYISGQHEGGLAGEVSPHVRDGAKRERDIARDQERDAIAAAEASTRAYDAHMDAHRRLLADCNTPTEALQSIGRDNVNVFREAMEAQLIKEDAARKAYIGDSSALTPGEKKTALALSKLSVEHSWHPTSARWNCGPNDFASTEQTVYYPDAPCPDCGAVVRFYVSRLSAFPAMRPMMGCLRAACPRCRKERRREEVLARKPNNTTTVTGSDGRSYIIRASYQTEVEGKFMDVPEARCEATGPLGRCSFSPGHQGDHYAWVDKGNGLTSYSWRSDSAVASKAKTPPVPAGGVPGSQRMIDSAPKASVARADTRCMEAWNGADIGSIVPCNGEAGHAGAHFNEVRQMKWDTPGLSAVVRTKPSDGLCSREHHGIRCVHAEGHGGYCHTPLGKGFNGPPAILPSLRREAMVVAFGIALELPSADACSLSRVDFLNKVSADAYRPELLARLKEGKDHSAGCRPDGLDQRIAESRARRAK